MDSSLRCFALGQESKCTQPIGPTHKSSYTIKQNTLCVINGWPAITKTAHKTKYARQHKHIPVKIIRPHNFDFCSLRLKNSAFAEAYASLNGTPAATLL